jgi:hypothetical protein
MSELQGEVVLQAEGPDKRFHEGRGPDGLDVTVLHGVDLRCTAARRWPSWAPPARARARCCTCWAGWTRRPPAASLLASATWRRWTPPSRAAGATSTWASSTSSTTCCRSSARWTTWPCRCDPPPASAAGPARRARAAGRVGLGARLAHRPGRALRRRAPARGHRPRPGQPAGLRAGRRAHRQPGPHDRRPVCSPDAGAGPRARHRLRAGHPRPGAGGALRPHAAAGAGARISAGPKEGPQGGRTSFRGWSHGLRWRHSVASEARQPR